MAALKADVAASLAKPPYADLSVDNIVIASRTELLPQADVVKAMDAGDSRFAVELKLHCAPGTGPSKADMSKAIVNGAITLPQLSRFVKEHFAARLPARYSSAPGSWAMVRTQVSGGSASQGGERSAGDASALAEGVPLLPVGAKLRRPVFISTAKVTSPDDPLGCPAAKKKKGYCLNGGYAVVM
jgi:hypothetical protein